MGGQYAASKNLAGGSIWSFDTDDFLGLCGGKFPLISAFKKGINGGDLPTTTKKPTTTTEPPTHITNPTHETTTTNKQTTATSGGCIPECEKEGFIRNRCDCQIYYECEKDPINGGFIRHEHHCAGEL